MITQLSAATAEFSYSFLILFREGFECFLVLFLVLGFLKKANQQHLNPVVYAAALLAVLASFIMAGAFHLVKVEFSGATEKIFEGVTMITTSLLLAGMILWLVRFKVDTKAMGREVTEFAGSNNKLGLGLLIFFSVFREGAETVLFFLVRPEGQAGYSSAIWGGISGFVAAFALCYAMFAGLIRLNFKRFFNTTTAFLLLVAAGLMAHGINELVQVNWLPPIIEPLWNINPDYQVLEDGTKLYPLWHEKGVIGGFLRAIFGYNGDPSLLEVLGYIAYMAVVGGLWYRWERRAQTNA